MIENLRELRLRAGLTQKELAKWAGIYCLTISNIEQGKHKPTELTIRKLEKALAQAAFSPTSAEAEKERPREEPTPLFPGEVLGRDEFFLRLRPKLSRALDLFFNQFLIMSFLENAEFFSRQRYYQGDFATAVEILGALLKAQKALSMPAGIEIELAIARRKFRKKR